MKKELQGRNNFTGFIPNRLEVEERPELREFSQNILFANVFNSNGVGMMASSIYVPDIDTYHQSDDGGSLTYRNIYNPENTVRITRYDDRWEGEKFINDKLCLLATGGTWEQFFTQLTIMGLSKGERCKYERLEDIARSASLN